MWLRSSLLVAAVFFGLVLWVMLRSAARIEVSHPRLERAWLAERKAASVERLRQLDRELRREFFARRRLLETGRYLLLAGALALLATAKLLRARRLPRPLPHPAEGELGQERGGARARGSVALLGLLLGAGGGLLAISRDVPLDALPAATAPAPSRPVPRWPRFRGPGGGGTFDGPLPDRPVVLWNVAVPLAGKSSPVLWGERLFLSGALRDRREVYCFDRSSGALVWRAAVPSAVAAARPLGQTGYAAPSVATDGTRVCAIFATGDLVCLDARDGRLLWARSTGPLDNGYGHASSPVIWRDRLLVQLDQAKGSRLLALDLERGRLLWEARRPVGASWTTPILVEGESGPLLVTCANPFVIAYDPRDGAERWRARLLAGDGGASPIAAGGRIFTVNIDSVLACLQPDGRVLWKVEDGLPDICSPCSDGRQVWLLESGGLVTCYDVASGKKQYEQDLAQRFVASPSLAGGRLLLVSQPGELLFCSSGPTFKLLYRVALGEPCETSPAFADGRIYLRGTRRLFCLGAATR